MKKRFITFLSGMVVGAVMFGGSVAYASGILADLSNNQILWMAHLPHGGVCDQRPQLCEIA